MECHAGLGANKEDSWGVIPGFAGGLSWQVSSVLKEEGCVEAAWGILLQMTHKQKGWRLWTKPSMDPTMNLRNNYGIMMWTLKTKKPTSCSEKYTNQTEAHNINLFCINHIFPSSCPWMSGDNHFLFAFYVSTRANACGKPSYLWTNIGVHRVDRTISLTT